MQNSLQSSEGALLDALFTNATEGMMIVSKEGELLGFNAACCRQTGYEANQLQGRPLQTLFPQKAPTSNIQFQNYEMRQQNGRFATVSVETRQLANGQFLLILRHPTQQNAALAQITRLTETISGINHLATNLNNLLTASEPLGQIATIIRELPGVFAVTVSTFRPETNELVVEKLLMPDNESGLLSHINELLGRSLIGLRIKLTKEIQQKTVNELITTAGNLHEISFGGIPQSVSTLFHKTFRLEKLYGLALTEGNDLIGGIVIVMRRDAEPLTRELRILLSRICAIALRHARYKQRLEASEAKLRSYIDHAPVGIFVVDRNGRYAETNPTALNLLGYTEEEIRELTISEVVHPDYIQAALHHFQGVMQQGYSQGEFCLKKKDGSLLWATVEAAKLSDERFIAFTQDITARKQAELSNQVKDRLLHITGEMAQVGGWEFDTRTLTGTWTDEVARIHDLDPSVETNTSFGLSFYKGEDRQKIEQAIEDIISQGVSYDLELPMTSAKGVPKWVRTMAIPIWEDGKIVKVRGIFQDITKAKEAQDALRQQIALQHQLSQIAATVPGMICSYRMTPEGHISMPYTSAALDDLYGLSAEALAQDASIVFEILHPDDKEKVLTTLERSAQNLEPWREEYRINHPRTGERWMEGHSMPHKEEDGSILWHGFVQDITKRKKAEQAQAELEDQLRQSQKMESIGRLAGGVAHDFNNLLTIIQMYSDLMYRQMAAEDPMRAKVEQIQQASQRAADLTGQLLAFSRKQILKPSLINLNGLVTNMQKLLTRLIGEDITLTAVLHDNLWPITADSGQMEQVIMNLAINARDAMPKGGMLTIETNNIILKENLVSSQLGTPIGPCVLMAITDTGQGMDEETQAHIFEPFFTTKEVGEGTGLGLAMVHGIIQQSEGSIFVYSEPGRGTTFKIYLPANSEDLPSIEPVIIAQEDLQYGNETILLVEDAKAVRDLVKLTLQDLGYHVLTGENGADALEIAQSYKDHIDLLLTDVVMPQMSGRELTEALQQLRPDIKVLFMSGYMDDAIVRHGILTAEVAFLPKPFSRHELSLKIHEVLNR
ncbi:MAG: PAS domain S-box protein [Ardenticatenaceae bacterium]|nr:PAS domain S-box protein [Ardenticatenaceae bacterium]